MGAKTGYSGSEEKNYEDIEPGVYAGNCIQVVELGTHENTHPLAEPGSKKKDLLIVWEITEELMEDGRPFIINKRYTNSLNEKAVLRKDLASWRGKDFSPEEIVEFDLGKILGKPCMLNIVARKGKKDPSKVYRNVASISPLPKGMNIGEPVNSLVNFGIEDYDNEEMLSQLYPWVRKIIEQSHEISKSHDDDEGDLPFPPK